MSKKTPTDTPKRGRGRPRLPAPAGAPAVKATKAGGAKSAKPWAAKPPKAVGASKPRRPPSPSPGAETPPAAQVVEIGPAVEAREVARAEGGAGAPAAEFHRELACQLTPEELARKGDELSAAVRRAHEVDGAAKEAARASRAELKGLAAQAEQLAEVICARAEERPVPCRRVEDPERKKVAVFRLDTGECVEARDMTESEAARARERPPAALGKDQVAAIKAFFERDRARFAAKEAQATGGDADPGTAKTKRAGGGATDAPGAQAQAGVSGLDPDGATSSQDPWGVAEAATVGRSVAPHDFDLRDVPGVGVKTRQALAEAGYNTIAALRGATRADLTAIVGVGQGVADRVLLYVGENFGEPSVPVAGLSRAELAAMAPPFRTRPEDAYRGEEDGWRDPLPLGEALADEALGEPGADEPSDEVDRVLDEALAGEAEDAPPALAEGAAERLAALREEGEPEVGEFDELDALAAEGEDEPGHRDGEEAQPWDDGLRAQGDHAPLEPEDPLAAALGEGAPEADPLELLLAGGGREEGEGL